jgi:leucyl aminopeptidase
VRAAADRAGEPVWPLPLPPEYRKLLDSEVADLKNVSSGGYGGALTAGLFLEAFVDRATWAHLDIAGPARAASDDGELTKGGTGFGVRTLLELASTFDPPPTLSRARGSSAVAKRSGPPKRRSVPR